jgi:thiol-disulfide isomerase/thioredoxin
LPVWQILTALIIGQWIIELPMRMTYFQESLISLPDTLHRTLGIICGFLYWRLEKPFSILTAVLGCSIAAFMFFQGYDYWLHKLNFGTFTGKVEASNLPAKFEAFDERNNFVTDENLSGKIVLLDFWHTRCGICFEKFPQVQALYDKYKNDSSVLIFAVDKPLEEDKPNQAFEIIREAGHSFPVVISKDEELPEKFGVSGYPTTFVIDRKGMIVYKGGIEGAVKMVDELKNN